MQPCIEKNTALALAAMDHALYFLEAGSNQRAAAYYQFAAQQLQTAVKALVQAEVVDEMLNDHMAIEKERADEINPDESVS